MAALFIMNTALTYNSDVSPSITMVNNLVEQLPGTQS